MNETPKRCAETPRKDQHNQEQGRTSGAEKAPPRETLPDRKRNHSRWSTPEGKPIGSRTHVGAPTAWVHVAEGRSLRLAWAGFFEHEWPGSLVHAQDTPANAATTTGSANQLRPSGDAQTTVCFPALRTNYEYAPG